MRVPQTREGSRRVFMFWESKRSRWLGPVFSDGDWPGLWLLGVVFCCFFCCCLYFVVCLCLFFVVCLFFCVFFCLSLCFFVCLFLLFVSLSLFFFWCFRLCLFNFVFVLVLWSLYLTLRFPLISCFSFHLSFSFSLLSSAVALYHCLSPCFICPVSLHFYNSSIGNIYA